MLDEISDEEYNRFYETLKFTIPKEGGYVNDPDDPGGETKWGISKKAHPQEDIKNLTPERAAEIYYINYWKPSGAANLPVPFCTAVFDTAVLCGVGRATRWMREAKGDLKTFLDLRRNHFLEITKKNPTLQKYLKGWMNRHNDLVKFVDIKKGA